MFVFARIKGFGCHNLGPTSRFRRVAYEIEFRAASNLLNSHNKHDNKVELCLDSEP